ncbi:MAG: hypothetical protein WAK71_27635 [Streptosporangiaceae bacterium]
MLTAVRQLSAPQVLSPTGQMVLRPMHVLADVWQTLSLAQLSGVQKVGPAGQLLSDGQPLSAQLSAAHALGKSQKLMASPHALSPSQPLSPSPQPLSSQPLASQPLTSSQTSPGSAFAAA